MPRLERLTIHRYWNQYWLSRSNIDWAYIGINRSASTFIRMYLLNNGFNKIDPRDYKNTHKLVVLREPLDRLLSSITFFKSGTRFIKNPKRFLTEFEFDPHVKLQKTFLEEVDLDNCTFIKYNDFLKQNLLNFITEHNTTMTIQPDDWVSRITPISNPNDADNVEFGSESYIRFQIADAIKNDETLRKIVMNYLDEDYKLYNSVRYYGTN